MGATKTYAVRTITLPVSLAEELQLRLRDCPVQPTALLFGNRLGGHRRYRVFGATPGTLRFEPSTLGASRAGALRCQ